MNTTATATTDRSRSLVAALPVQNGLYARPGLPDRQLRLTDHDTDHGFCSVCGAVWPCARARRDQRLDSDPFARSA